MDLGAINGASRAPPALQDFFRGARQFPPGPLFFSPRMPCGSIFQQHFPQNDDTRTPQSQCLMAIPKTALGPDAPTSFEIPTTVEHTKKLPIASTFDKNPIKKGNFLGFLAMRAAAGRDAHAPGPPGMARHAQPRPAMPRENARQCIRFLGGLAHRVWHFTAFQSPFHTAPAPAVVDTPRALSPARAITHYLKRASLPQASRPHFATSCRGACVF